MKSQASDGEKIFSIQLSDKDTVSRMYKEHLRVNSTNNLILFYLK